MTIPPVTSTRTRDRSDSDHSIGGRLAAAFASLFFSLPVCGLLWLAVNVGLSRTSGYVLASGTLLWVVGLMAAFSFAFPRLFPTLFGWLCDALLAIGRYW